MAAFMSLPASRTARRRSHRPACALALAALLTAGPALADALIVNASSPQVEAGQWLRPGDAIEVEAPMDLTVLESGSLRVLRLETGRFIYKTAQADTDEPKAVMLASVVSGLLSPEDDVIQVGATRGRTKKAGSACPAPTDVAPTASGAGRDLDAVAVLSDSGCDEVAKALLDQLIADARAQAGLGPSVLP